MQHHHFSVHLDNVVVVFYIEEFSVESCRRQKGSNKARFLKKTVCCISCVCEIYLNAALRHPEAMQLKHWSQTLTCRMWGGT